MWFQLPSVCSSAFNHCPNIIRAEWLPSFQLSGVDFTVTARVNYLVISRRTYRRTGGQEGSRHRLTLQTRFPTKPHLVWLRNLVLSSARVDEGHSPTVISWMFSCAHTHKQQKAVMIELYPDDKPRSFITHQPAPRSTCASVPIYGAGMWTCCCCCRFGPHHLDLNH